jgi:hypothetical protein
LVTRRTIESRARDIEEASGRKLTQRQKEFARIFVDGRHSNAECARQAGYAADSANVQASVLLKGERFPHLIEYINELVSPLSSPNLYLFDGDQGKNLMIHGLKSNGQGPVVECLWSGSGFWDLVHKMHDIAKSRVRESMVKTKWVGVGSGRDSGSG